MKKIIKVLFVFCIVLSIICNTIVYAESEESILENQGAVDLDIDNKPSKNAESERVKYAKGRFKKRGLQYSN